MTGQQVDFGSVSRNGRECQRRNLAEHVVDIIQTPNKEKFPKTLLSEWHELALNLLNI